MAAKGVDENPQYWGEYSNLQKVKHDLIREYLNGWFPKLGNWAGRILYFDTHAGRGRYAGGEYGSPLVALNTFLAHSWRDKILQKSEVRFSFIERDEANLDHLKTEIEAVGALPRGVTVHPQAGECFELLRHLVDNMKAAKSRLAPAFVFVDPYGFKVPGAILRELMQFGSAELFVNVIWRELDMAIQQGPSSPLAGTLDSIFDGDAWTKIDSDDFDERADQAVDLLRKMTGARWATRIRMLGPNNATRYLLVHLTNHDAGRDLMKDCIWKVCPDGGYYARKSDDPRQQMLITPQPDLAPLEQWLRGELAGGGVRWQELDNRLRETVWRSPHLTDVVRRLRKSGELEASSYKGNFSRKANPLLSLRGES